jgi:hypothetical protein
LKKNKFKEFKKELLKYKPQQTLLDYSKEMVAAYTAKNADRYEKEGMNPDRGSDKIFFNPYDHLEHGPEAVVNDMEAIKVR